MHGKVLLQAPLCHKEPAPPKPPNVSNPLISPSLQPCASHKQLPLLPKTLSCSMERINDELRVWCSWSLSLSVSRTYLTQLVEEILGLASNDRRKQISTAPWQNHTRSRIIPLSKEHESHKTAVKNFRYELVVSSIQCFISPFSDHRYQCVPPTKYFSWYIWTKEGFKT